ncbi:alkaline phosphatase family protein [Bacillus sp. 31A1R]|uniref:Alkaline phosphatase family protein n=1 Tax=Robertmurraya mangrovi TaxID=3098077 RepID=A0ABU5IWJ4_9BACI|nr:alkaline phosphatase family protein [Bacillus sp. 31A1R]MDZ5471502.1 alkaline phosphatase family protein [Bacillus sp. 31A1R]
MIKLLTSVVIIVLAVGILYSFLIKTPTNQTQINQSSGKPTKKVVMIIIDSLMDQPLQKAIHDGKAPTFKFLMEQGRYYPQMVSSFPTMSVSIDSTLLTGTYPDKHKVPALVWYDEKEKQFISYGSAAKEILKLGPKQVFNNSLFHLNHKHLSNQVRTIHEELEGKTASVNTLVYRGKQEKPLNTPRILNMLGYLKEDDVVLGPDYFSYGLLSKIKPNNKYIHIWEAFGFNDHFAIDELKYLIENQSLPAFSLIYLSDNDKEVHKKGDQSIKGIEKADKKLEEVFQLYKTWEDATQDTVWIIMGDSGQTFIENNKNESLIDLPKLLANYKIHKISEPIQESDQIVLGLNERMSFIYLLDKEIQKENIVMRLIQDSRIDHIAWLDGNMVRVASGDYQEALSFQPGGPLMDPYGQSWLVEGNLQILDLTVNDKNEIAYSSYPDGLARLYSSFFSHEGNYLVVNAKPGFEFVGEGSPTHVGGASHGSLHKDDTHFPMLVVGTELEPINERILDLKEWIIRIVKDE